MSLLTLRKASSKDLHMLWNWANDPIVRSSAFSTESIAWENHSLWFNKKLENANSHIYIAETNSKPIGQIRFDCNNEKAEVDVHLAPEARGQGLGTPLILEGVRKLFSETEVNEIHSTVKLENLPSSKIFLKAGFENLGTETVNSCEVYHYVLIRQ